MKIRKKAFKVLGSASVYAATTWPPSPAMTAAADTGGAEGFIVCELNCSPWDVMLMDNNPNSCSFLANPKEEDESEGILGKLKKRSPLMPITSTAADLTLKEIKEIEEKKVKRKKSKDNKEKASTEMLLITYCKKNDGKGWHCKRPAQLPHSFCSYHLGQTRAYSSSHRASATDHASEAATAAETRAEGGDSDNLYYYYDGFGPWRGKKGGRALIVSAKVREEEKEDGRASVDRRGGDDDDDNVVAGDDEYDLDCFDVDDHVNDCNSMSHQHKTYKENGKKNEVDQLGKNSSPVLCSCFSDSF